LQGEYEIPGSQGCEYEDHRQLWGYSAVIALMMEAVRIPKTSVYFNEITRRYIPQGCHLQNLTEQL
jgi:hypothetical protein